jgi:hypothetical protein
MVEIKTASTAERAAILVVLKMLDEVKGLHVQTEGHECGCKEYVVEMIEALSADGQVVAKFAAQRQQSRVWREMQARREKQPEQPEEEPIPKSRLRRGRTAPMQPAQPEPMPKRAKTQPKAPKAPKAAPKNKKNKNLYTKHLRGLAVTGVLHGGSDSQIALGVKIDDSGKTKMMARYLKGRPQADLDQVIGAVLQFMSSAQESGALSEYDRVACERFIFLIELLGAPYALPSAVFFFAHAKFLSCCCTPPTLWQVGRRDGRDRRARRGAQQHCELGGLGRGGRGGLGGLGGLGFGLRLGGGRSPSLVGGRDGRDSAS